MMVQVESEAILETGYDSTASTLYVRFFHDHIRDRYRHKRL